jgi:hypothetical protein
MQTYAEKVQHAAGRHVTNYPTVARMLVPATDLRWVGTYDYEANRLNLTNQTELDAWRKQ